MLNHILRQGDRVRMRMSSDSRSYGQKGVPDGTLGTVAGRDRSPEFYEHRYPVSPYIEPGVYTKDTQPIVIWDEYPDGVDPMDPEYARVSAIWLEPADTFFKEYNLRAEKEWPVRLPNGDVNPDFCIIKDGHRLDHLERVGDLPETDFWEQDLVSWHGQRYQIRRINYDRWGPEKLHCYEMEEVDENNVYRQNGSTTVEPSELELIERGNVWRFHHGEEPIFHSLSQEISFAIGMNQTETVRNPSCNLYMWTMNEIHEGLKSGIVDGFMDPSYLKNLNRFTYSDLIRYKNRDLGERIRQSTLTVVSLHLDKE